MATGKPTPPAVAADIRRILRDGGSAEHAKGVQWFFKDEIKSHGWYTAALRKAALRSRREMPRTWPGFPGAGRRPFFSGRNSRREEFRRFSARKTDRRISATMNSSCSPLGLSAYQVGPITTRWCTICWRRWSVAEAGRCREDLPVGEVAESLAAARRVRGADQRSARAACFS